MVVAVGEEKHQNSLGRHGYTQKSFHGKIIFEQSEQTIQLLKLNPQGPGQVNIGALQITPPDGWDLV